MIEQHEQGPTGYLLIDLDKPGPTQDRRVRCGLSLAVDRDELGAAVGGGILPAANGLFSPGQEGHLDDNGGSATFDLDGARRLIDEYAAETGSGVRVELRVTNAPLQVQLAELLVSQWNAVGVDVEWATLPQDSLISTALFGRPEFTVLSWRGHAGITVDEQSLWWNSAGAAPDGELAINLGRLRDPIVDEQLAVARSAVDAGERRAAAEAINRRMAEQCYQIPLLWQIWGFAHEAEVRGLDGVTLPDGAEFRTEQSFNGQVRFEGVWLASGG